VASSSHGPIRLVVSDLDGTLLNPDETIPAEAVQAVRALHERDIAFTIVSGRPIPFMQHIVEQMGVILPAAGCNGAVVFDRSAVLERHTFTLEPLRQLIEQATASGATVLYYTDRDTFTFGETAWIVSQKGTIREYRIHCPSETEWRELPVTKLSLIFRGHAEAYRQVAPSLDQLGQHYSLNRYRNTNCEIMAAGVSKASGLHSISRLTGIPLEQIMAIGDDVNDIGMLRCAGIGVAVNNAKTVVKQAAGYVCSAGNTAGVLEAIARFT